jgi:putative membrane protein
MWVWWILGIALVVAVVWVIARAGGRGQEPRHESSEEILKRRYANGEIDHEEYERRLQDLRK